MGASAQRTPIVSVVMPTYNAGEYLQAAVDSIFRQTYPHWELVIVDDGSSDGSVERLVGLDDPRITVVRQKNAGKPAAMNRALAAIRGEFYALQDADDISHPDRLERQLACILEHPEVAGVYSGYEMMIEGRVFAPTFRAKSVKECAQDIQAGHMPALDPSAMYRVALVKEFLYEEDLPVVEGMDYILRIGERHPLIVLGECLYTYRVHPGSVTKRDPARRNALADEVVVRMCRRRGIATEGELERRRAMRSWKGDADNDLVSHVASSVADLIMAGRRSEALRAGLESWRLHPLTAYYAKPLIYALAPAAVIRRYRAAKEQLRTRRAEAPVRA